MNKILYILFVITLFFIGFILPTAGALLLCIGGVATYLIFKGG
jgi:hypothetical protein